MKLRMAVPMLFAIAGLLLATPAEVVGQEATLRAQATILAPVKVPTVRVEAELVAGEQRPVVVVTSEESWGVLVGPAGQERSAAVRQGEGRRWESLPGPASGVDSSEPRAIRVVLSAL